MSLAALSGFANGFATSRRGVQDRQDRRALTAALTGQPMPARQPGFLSALGIQPANQPAAPPGATPAAAGGVPGGVRPPAMGIVAGDPLSWREAIASIESAGSGNYAAVGPTNERLGRALGRYQVMEANIGPWSEAALGRRITADEFLANPDLQDKIFDHQFGSYVQQFGPAGAAQAWFAGPGGVGKLDRADVLGTTVAAYTDKFNRALGVGSR